MKTFTKNNYTIRVYKKHTTFFTQNHFSKVIIPLKLFNIIRLKRNQYKNDVRHNFL